MRKFSLLLLMLIAVLGSNSVSTHAMGNGATVERMRFHCENDTIKINNLLAEGLHSGLKTANELVVFYAHKLEGTPYVGHTLEGEEEKLTINIDELDCTTFVETLYALSRTTLSGRYSWRDYAHNLENLRYRHGEMGDYSSRLHYMSDWIIDNSNRGNIVDVTSDIACVRYKIKDINFMSTHRNSYVSLKSDDVMLEKIRNFEIGYRNHRFPYIKKEQLNSKDVRKVVKRGDFVGLVTRTEGLDISHLGIIELDAKGNPVLLDASSRGKKVMLEPVDLRTQLSKSKDTEGVRIFRMKE
ncbi:MAG: DUF1460 domain-containing protein [Bacteroidales bacterium]|nr:DUF1460 domain-containing protein [Muribaculaceae bacterium]MDY6294151.1 DUF1460 domain-containing protein [Bacteroidales bacterium]